MVTFVIMPDIVRILIRVLIKLLIKPEIEKEKFLEIDFEFILRCFKVFRFA